VISRVSVSGEFALDRSKQYRKNATNSLMFSREATTRASHHWLTMAEFWFKLAQHAEETEGAVADHEDEADKGMSRPVW
jgi:hypothetical protein